MGGPQDTIPPSLHPIAGRGSASLFINPLASAASLGGSSTTSAWPDVNASLWNASKRYSTNELNVQLQYASYYITVLGSVTSPPTPSGASVNFTLHARLESPGATVPAYPPVPSPGTVSAVVIPTEQLLTPSDPMSMLIGWNSSPATVRQYLYRVFYARSDIVAPTDAAAVASSLPCATSAATVSASDGALLPGVTPGYASPDACVLATACGVEGAATPAGPWVAVPGGGVPAYATVSGLAQQTAYSFQVLVQDPVTGAQSAYAAGRGTPAYTKVNAAVSYTTLGGVLGGALGAFLCVVGIAFFVKKRIDRHVHERAMRRYHAVRTKEDDEAARAKGEAGGGAGAAVNEGAAAVRADAEAPAEAETAVVAADPAASAR